MRRRQYGTLQVLAAAALWGTTGPVQVMAGLRVTPAAVGALRIATGGLVLLAWTAARRRSWPAPLPQGVAWPLLAASGATGAFQAAYFTAVSRTGAALATAIVFGLAPVATGLCSRLIDRSPLTLGWAVGTLCAVAGCALLLTPDPASGGADPVGVVLSVIAGVCYAVYTVAAKRLTDSGEDVVTAVAVTLVVGGLVLMPWLATAGPDLFTGRALITIAWLGPVTTALAYMLFVRGLRTVSAATAGTLSLAEPLVAAILAIELLHEHLGLSALAGCALLAAGLAIASLRPSRTSNRSHQLGNGTNARHDGTFEQDDKSAWSAEVGDGDVTAISRPNQPPGQICGGTGQVLPQTADQPGGHPSEQIAAVNGSSNLTPRPHKSGSPNP